ncbi:MAG: hypothetical protein IAE95_11785 [Chitinophagaceae bacterium]|nr:hypothetical protein [Chitinophagaceae bacterium]
MFTSGTDKDRKYWYHVEDGQFSFDFEDEKLLGDEGDIIKAWSDGDYEKDVYILYVEGSHVECIGDIERSFPKNWAEHMETRKMVQAFHISDEEDDD